jgi:hypothetical protein
MASAKEEESFRRFSKEQGKAGISRGASEWIFIWRPWKAALKGWVFFFIAFTTESSQGLKGWCQNDCEEWTIPKNSLRVFVESRR